MNSQARVHIHRQPTEVSCGPTCLHAVYNYYDYQAELDRIIEEVPSLPTGGTMAVHLGMHALKSGFKAKIYTYNITIFDPTWFYPKPLSSQELIFKLRKQKRSKRDNDKLYSSCEAYIHYLEAGGKVVMRDISEDLLLNYLEKGTPLLTGLSSTYLYRAPRERVLKTKQVTDDVRGDPEGHFVVIEKYEKERSLVTIADPFATNPFAGNLRYNVPLSRLVTALLLGVLTYDANFLVIEPNPDDE